jgi:hypothetical protein
MRLRTATILLISALWTSAAFAGSDSPDSKPAPPDLNKRMTSEDRMMVIRSLTAEMVFAHRPLPMGDKGLTIKDGKVSPDGQEVELLLQKFGPAVKAGERAQITTVVIKDKALIFEINGGPKKKTKWYEHVQVGMGPTMGSPGAGDQPSNPKGSLVELAFDKFVPEMTGDQIRSMLSPVLDFNAKSAVEAYLETVPPQVKEAIKNHQVLVGMNREMVSYAKGKPDQKIRETDPATGPYEEWIFGQPPSEVQFVRFTGDEVSRLEIMKVDGTKDVRTAKEVNLPPPRAQEVNAADEPKKPAGAPTLRRPGEAPEESGNGASGNAPSAGAPSSQSPPPQAPAPQSPQSQ